MTIEDRDRDVASPGQGQSYSVENPAPVRVKCVAGIESIASHTTSAIAPPLKHTHAPQHIAITSSTVGSPSPSKRQRQNNTPSQVRAKTVATPRFIARYQQRYLYPIRSNPTQSVRRSALTSKRKTHSRPNPSLSHSDNPSPAQTPATCSPGRYVCCADTTYDQRLW